MKKSLLIMVAALFVAIGANAQKKHIAQPVKLANRTMSVKGTTALATTSKDMRQASYARTNRAGSIDGTYILDAANFDADFTASSSFTITSQTGTITLDMYEGTPSFEYNVVLNGFTYASAVVYGNYSAEYGIIEIPVQKIAYNDTYKDIYISGGARVGTTSVNYGKAIYLVDNGDGTFDIDEDYDPTDAEDFATEGWVSFLPNYEGGGLWNYGFDIQAFAPNGEMQTDVSGYLRTDGLTSGWQDERAVFPIYVEDFGTEMVVHGFGGFAPISVLVNGDGTCAIPLPQFVDDYDYSEEGGFAYGCMRLMGVDIVGDKLSRNKNKTSHPGSIYTSNSGLKVADFFEIDAEGKVIQDETHSPYLAVCSDLDSEGLAYTMGNYFAIRLLVDDSATGISNVKAEGKAAVGKTYNLMGQEVTASTKGLVIRDGKKFINK